MDIIYYDTDSCIYVSTSEPNEYESHTGNFLGNMTDELESYVVVVTSNHLCREARNFTRMLFVPRKDARTKFVR